MKNFKKEGYSVSEAAQILHCCVATIHNYIDNGILGASLSFRSKETGKKRRIRVLKEHIADFMLAHRDRFTKEELDTWGKFKKDDIPASDSKPFIDPTTGTCFHSDSDGVKTAVNRLEDLTGAWASLFKPEVRAFMGAGDAKDEEKEPDIELDSIDSYSISIDGRIAVGNISHETTSKIIDALLSDGQISYSEITIKKGVAWVEHPKKR